MRVKILVSLAAVTAIGYALKFYRGPGDEWINNTGPASIPYEMMLMLIAFIIVPRRESVMPIAIGVCVVTCALEFLQLYTSPWLEAVRGNFLGRALLGTTFSWWDMPAYPLGCFAGYWFLMWLLKKKKSEHQVETPCHWGPDLPCREYEHNIAAVCPENEQVVNRM